MHHRNPKPFFFSNEQLIHQLRLTSEKREKMANQTGERVRLHNPSKERSRWSVVTRLIPFDAPTFDVLLLVTWFVELYNGGSHQSHKQISRSVVQGDNIVPPACLRVLHQSSLSSLVHAPPQYKNNQHSRSKLPDRTCRYRWVSAAYWKGCLNTWQVHAENTYNTYVHIYLVWVVRMRRFAEGWGRVINEVAYVDIQYIWGSDNP